MITSYPPMHKNQGLTLVELMVAMVLGISIMAGVMQVLVASKSNFTTERELATLQENARFALKFMSDEIRMAGFSGCNSGAQSVANSINGSPGSWFLSAPGLQGYDESDTFPTEFASDVTANTDAIVVRKASPSGLKLSGTHNPNSAVMRLNDTHAYKPGQVMIVSTPDCQQSGIFKMSGPTNTNDNATTIVHNTGGGKNCTKFLGGNFTCSSSGSASSSTYPPGSSMMVMESQAFYVGTSSVGNGIPALYRELMFLSGSTPTTTQSELVQGVENMQILYGLDNALSDGVADIYLPASSGSVVWTNVVSIRLSLRMRSIYPIYSEDVAYSNFEGVANTSGADRFMRQLITTTIQLRN